MDESIAQRVFGKLVPRTVRWNLKAIELPRSVLVPGRLFNKVRHSNTFGKNAVFQCNVLIVTKVACIVEL